MRITGVLLPAILVVGFSACRRGPSEEAARKFVEDAEARLLTLASEASRAQWVQATYLTDDTEAIAAQANQRLTEATVQLAKEAAQYDALELSGDVARKLRLLKVAIVLPAPSEPREGAESARLAARLEAAYGQGRYCPSSNDAECLTIDGITRLMASSRDPKELQRAWEGWHAIGRPMRDDFRKLADLTNRGARELGFQDAGQLWRSKYDMPPADFARECERLWEQVKPLYVKLHTYVRWKLRENYGPELVPERGPIPVFLLGNLWAQEWGNIYPLVAPKGGGGAYDLTSILKTRKATAHQMVKYGESFFLSLGFPPLPKTFWSRSLFTRPSDREVVCHASAWDVDNVDDLRIKMCIDTTEEDFRTIHHELGHNFYQRAYNRQPFLYRDSANDGFHEAIGDTIALSVTPEYLVKIGLLERAPAADQDIGWLLKQALDKVAFLPFGLMIDQWRWRVYSGEIRPDQYNQTWWELKWRFQGVAPPPERGEQHFDPGAKYHVPASVPYTRYFLAHILQFQLHKALAETAGCREALHRCSIQGSAEAGGKLRTLMSAGLSQPWQASLNRVAGADKLDAAALRAYFAPLEKWLDEQNAGKPEGW